MKYTLLKKICLLAPQPARPPGSIPEPGILPRASDAPSHIRQAESRWLAHGTIHVISGYRGAVRLTFCRLFLISPFHVPPAMSAARGTRSPGFPWRNSRPEQRVAAEAMLAHETGVLSATTAFGNAVVAAWLSRSAA